jgi:hypothetical protein
MSAPITARVAQGEHWTPIFTFRDSTGAVIDLTDSSLSVVMRLKRASDTAITRTKGAAGETSYPASGTDGRLQFLFSPTDTAAMTAGDYRLEIVYGDTDPTPDNKVIAQTGTVTVYAPGTGTI